MSTTRRFGTEAESAQFIIDDIKAFVCISPANRMSVMEGHAIYDEPLVQFADGDDSIFTEFKTIINPAHLTPREALVNALEEPLERLPAHLSVISWILPITAKTRESNRPRKRTPSHLWSNTRWYGEKFNEALREHVVKLLIGMGYRATAPMSQSYFHVEYTDIDERGYYSNWSERHIAYAAGLGTFSLSDGFITERGIAQRCGSVVTDLVLPVSPRTANDPYSNCMFYVDGSCNACIARCPAGAITKDGHDKTKCETYLRKELRHLLKEYGVGITGCGLCQTDVPCEYRNPTKKNK